MKPFPNELDYGDVVDGVDTRMVTFNAMQSVAFERARADWYESEVVPLLKLTVGGNHLHWSRWRQWRSEVDAVLRELEGKS